MVYCHNCGAELPGGANYCPYCGTVLQGKNNTYHQIPNTPHDTLFRQASPPSAEMPQTFDENQQFYFQQKLSESLSDAANAKVLGIVSIVCAVFNAFAVVCWICGAIGIAKANAAMMFAEQTGNMPLYNDARFAKTLNKVGLLLSAVLLAVGVGAICLFAFGLGGLDNIT